MGGGRGSGAGAGGMAKRGKVASKTVDVGDANKGVGSDAGHGVQDLTYLDLFPYNPHYSFNGFRSLVGTGMSLLFLFAVFLRVVTTAEEFYKSRPIVTTKSKPIVDLNEAVEIQDTLQVAFKLSDSTTGLNILDDTVLKVHADLGVLAGPNRVSYFPLSNVTRDLSTSSGLITYPDLMFVQNNANAKMVLEGDLPLPVFKFIRLRVEQCRNTSAWLTVNGNPGFVVTGSTTAGLGVTCKPQNVIDDLLAIADFTLFMTETNLDPDAWDNVDEFLYTLQRGFLSNVFLRHQLFIEVTRVSYLSRYVFDDTQNANRYYKVAREDSAVSDQTLVTGPGGVEHIYRMEYIIRLDRLFKEEARDHDSIYAMFESWAASCIFFAFSFGLVGWAYNRHSFREQTRGLDIRKMDRDQFDRFGRLVDKSFQMPRELQDMQAE